MKNRQLPSFITLVAVAALPLACACKTSSSPEPIVIIKTDAPPPPTATAMVTATEAPAAVAPPPEPEPDLPPFEEPIVERAVFRHVITGMLIYQGRRLTWTFERGKAKARLGLTCQTALSQKQPQLGMRLNGEEMIEGIWTAGGAAEIRGDVVAESPLHVRFATVRSKLNETCGKLSSSFELTCKKGQVSVLAAGAKLVVGPKGNREIPPTWWQPAGRDAARGLVCDVVLPEGEHSLLPALWSSWQFFFTGPKGRSPGAEWAHENSDMVVQTGAYRWMPPSPSR